MADSGWGSTENNKILLSNYPSIKTIFKCWNKKLLTKTPAKLFLKIEGEIKIFSDKEILNEFISSRATLQKNKTKS